jgi:hypothetical protein
VTDNTKSAIGNVVQCSPHAGQEGTEVTVTMQSALADVDFKIAFGSIVVDTKKLSSMDMHTLVAAAPNHVLTQCTTYSVPVSVCAYRGDTAIQTWTVGRFNYVSNGKFALLYSFRCSNVSRHLTNWYSR